MQEPFLANNFLVGGTGLALQMGHRLSVDLDLFTHKPFDAEQLLASLQEKYTVQPLTVTNTIFIVVLEGVKVDCVYFCWMDGFLPRRLHPVMGIFPPTCFYTAAVVLWPMAGNTSSVC